MPVAFDHVPVVTMTDYGPSIHDDPVAMDNETLRLAGVTDLRWTPDGLALQINAQTTVLDVLYAVAAEISGPNGSQVIGLLKDLDWACSRARMEDSAYSEELTHIEDELLQAIGSPDTAVTLLLRGVAGLVLRDRITDETPREVFRAHKAILDARDRATGEAGRDPAPAPR